MPSIVSTGLAIGVLVISHQASTPLAFLVPTSHSGILLPGTMKTTTTTDTPTPTPSAARRGDVVSMVEDDYYSGGAVGGGFGTNDGSAGTGGDETQLVRVEPDTHEELMYALGVNLARQLGDVRPLVENGDELAQVAKGLLDTVVGRLNDDGQRLLLSKRGQELDDLIMHRANVLREKLELRGREMLKNMQETEGVAVLDTGVCVHVLDDTGPADQSGARPTSGSVVLIHYHGTLSDGTVFDSTLGGEPVRFPLAQVIPGWRDGLLQMRVGQTAMLGIPPEEAYGPMGTPDGRIPGGSTLFFKVQLVDVLSSGIGGGAADPSTALYGADGQQLGGGQQMGTGLIGADGNPMY